jgi:hypothetical protein
MIVDVSFLPGSLFEVIPRQLVVQHELSDIQVVDGEVNDTKLHIQYVESLLW